jgi:RNA polymerase sigma factor (sigma-70 family)
LKTLIQRHSALCFDICKKYSSAISKNGLRVEDVTEEKEFLIYKSAISFNPEKKTKFSTWLGNQVRYYCLNLMNKNNLIPTEDGQLDFFINKDVSYEPYSMEEKMDYINNIVDQIKDKRIQKIITLRYFNNPNKKTPWNKVAQEIGVSTQTAINLHNKAMGLLRTKMENKNIFAIDKI